MLTRVKTFVATGLATAGRLYAGDLNSIQDAVAAQSDYAQRVDALTFGVGESGLAITRYGAGEVRLTGALRLDAILRALGGLYAGQFTTTQRDAIASGQAPNGLIIYNTTTSRYEYNKGTEASRNWQPLSGINVEANGAGAVSEGGINLIAGSGITITIVDNPGTGYADVTIAAPPASVGGTVPIGGVVAYGGASDPTNFLICDGRSLLRAGTYAALFAAIGTAFGTADGTHFNIPDIRNRVPTGKGSNIALGQNEGNVEGQRHIKHYHNYSAPYDAHGGFTAGGAAPAAIIAGQTSGNAFNLDSPAFVGLNWAIRYQ